MANSITPPPELVKQWLTEPEYVSSWNGKCMMLSMTDYRFSNICAKAAQWGADQELEACCQSMKSIPSPLGVPFGKMASNALRAARRPKPPSLKEQALEQLDEISTCFRVTHMGDIVCDKIRAALETLDG